MRKMTASLLLACLMWGGAAGGFGRAGVGAQEGQRRTDEQQADERQWQPEKSREFGDSIWDARKPPPRRQQAKRRKYQRVAVASSSAVAVKLRRAQPQAALAPARRRRPAAPAVRPNVEWQDVALESSGQVGVTVWRLRRCGNGGDGRRCFLRLYDDAGRPFFYEALRVGADADFRVGDGLQLAVESPVRGYIYVFHQEVYRGGRVGEPKLLYPLREGVNAVGPGRPLLIPTQTEGDGVKVLRMRNEQGKDLSAERLKIIIASRPLAGVFAQDRPRRLGEDLRLWETDWSGRLELFDWAGGDREHMTLNEWRAMQGGHDGSRDLTTGDLAPQKLYLVERRRDDGVLITLDLPYGG